MDSLNSFNVSKFSNSKNETFGLQCKLCQIKRFKFYCQSCVKNGDFTDSQKIHCPERFADKGMKLIVALRKKKEFGLEDKLRARFEVQLLKQEIKSKTEKVRLLECIVEEKRSECQKQVVKIEKILLKIERTKLCNARSRRHVGIKTDSLKKSAEKLNERMSLLSNIYFELSAEMASEVQLLVKYIFQIEEVKKSDEAVVGEPCSTVCQLDEATRTAYINGNWVHVGNEESYRIVKSELPASGDYSMYYNWLSTYGTSGANCEFGSSNCLHGMSAALTYTSQILSVLSFIFNIRLPHKLSYSEFCLDGMTDSILTYKVAKLNANVMYLCLAQGMDTELIHPRKTLFNLSLLFNEKHCQYRRTKDLCQESSMVDVLEDQLVADLNSVESDDESEDGDKSSIHEGNLDISPDWEAVPRSIPNDEISSSNERSAVPSSDQGFTGSIVSSAAASVVSFWRGYAGQK